MRSGSELVLELTGMAERLLGKDLIIAGEGSPDRPTLRGKAPAGIAASPRAACVPDVAAGRHRLTPAELAATEFVAAFARTDIEPNVRRCLAHAEPLLGRLGVRIADEVLNSRSVGTPRRHAAGSGSAALLPPTGSTGRPGQG